MEPTQQTSGGSSRKGFLKFAIAFVAILLLGYVAFVIAYNVQHWDQIQFNKASEEAVEQWLDVYRNDKAGGKTPDETIDLFIAALEAGDVELATSYFMPDDYGNRDEEGKMMQEVYDNGDFPRLANIMKNRVIDRDGIIGEKFYSFNFRENGEPAGGVSLQFNGNVWKIEHF